MLSTFRGLAGMNVIISPYALETTQVPVRVHTQSLSMSDAYHKRIQKKWNKRWGFVRKPCMYQTAEGFIMHPALADDLERLTERRVEKQMQRSMSDWIH